jgi:hypothetical protein
MATRKTPPAPPQDIRLSPGQLKAGIARFARRIKDVEAFEPEKVSDRRDPNVDALEASIAEALSQTFGHDTPTRRLYAPAATLDTAGYNMNGTPHHEVTEGLVHGKQRALVLLNRAIKSLEEQIADHRDESHAWPGAEAASVDSLARTPPNHRHAMYSSCTAMTMLSKIKLPTFCGGPASIR